MQVITSNSDLMKEYEVRLANDPEFIIFLLVELLVTGGMNKNKPMIDDDYWVPFGQSVIKYPWNKWTFKQKKAAYTMCRKYAALIQNKIGIPMSRVPYPEEHFGQNSLPQTIRSDRPLTGAIARNYQHAENQRKKAYATFKSIDLSDDGKDALVKYGNLPGEEQLNMTRRIRQFSSYRWDEKTMVWKIPLTSHTAQEIDDFAREMGFTASEEVQAAILDRARIGAFLKEASWAQDADGFEVPGLRLTLRNFQKACVKFGVIVKRVLYGDDMGLGKTIEAIATMWYLKSFPVLIVTPKRLKKQWERHIKNWLGPDIKVMRSTNSHLDVNELFASEPDVLLIHYDILVKNINVLIQCPWQAIVFDEAHRLKNKKAQRSRSALRIVYKLPVPPNYNPADEEFIKLDSKELDYSKLVARNEQGIPVRMILTGTPAQNRPEEILMLLEIMCRVHEIAPRGVSQFKQMFCAGNENLPVLHSYLRSTCMVRRLRKDCLPELPPIQVNPVFVEISNQEEYDYALEQFLEWVHEKAPEWAERDKKFKRYLETIPVEEWSREIARYQNDAVSRAMKAEQLVKINRLRTLVAKGKMAAILDWTEDFLDSDEKLVLFSHSIPVQEDLIKHLSRGRQKIASILGGMSEIASDESQRMFMEDDDCRVMVGSALAGGEGLDMYASSNVVLCDLGWTPAEHDQLIARVARMGQKASSVNAWFMLAADTIDEWMMEVLDEKKKMADMVMDGHTSEEGELLAANIRSKSMAKDIWLRIKQLAKQKYGDIDPEWADSDGLDALLLETQ